MPIFDASPLDRANGDAKALRDVLGPAKRAPRHAKEMRDAARESERAPRHRSVDQSAERLADAIQKASSPLKELIRRLHSPA